LRVAQFAATEELTSSEKSIVALDAVERLLVDPPEIDRALRKTMTSVRVSEVLFAEPSAEGTTPIKPVSLAFTQREKLVDLLAQVRREVGDVR